MTALEYAAQTAAYFETPNACTVSKPRQVLIARCIRAVLEAAKEENDYEPHSAKYWQHILTGENEHG